MAQYKPACRIGRDRIGELGSLLFRRQSIHDSSAERQLMQWVGSPKDLHKILLIWLPGKVGMSVLTKGMAMDFVREGKKDMAITSIWPASVSPFR
jgi:hypothetical protein